jgi:ribosome-binding factor A
MKGRLRKMPELYFYIDEALDREAEIERILKNGGESPIK